MTSIPPSASLVLDPVCDDTQLTILRAMPAQRRTGPPVVVFNSINTKPRQRPEFIGTVARLNRPVLFVLDRQSTWYATPGIVARVTAAIEAAMADWGAEAVDTLGFSMGAYPAIAYAERVPVRHAVSLSPRFSPDPAIVPDPRHRPNLDRLSGTLALPTLAPGLARVQSGLILHGLRGPDLCQFRHIHAPGGVDHWLLPMSGHFVMDWLRRYGQMEAVILAGLQGNRTASNRLLAGLGAVRHRSLRARLLLYPVRALDDLRLHLRGKRTA